MTYTEKYTEYSHGLVSYGQSIPIPCHLDSTDYCQLPILEIMYLSLEDQV